MLEIAAEKGIKPWIEEVPVFCKVAESFWRILTKVMLDLDLFSPTMRMLYEFSYCFSPGSLGKGGWTF
ncbi:uncharacterized protein PRCAT00003461001 [Priceomyces carsonii]|uniref:uncharacterized protein n=1 Tax=Priceomyces carsonii TaxID=28549 RepID=UPI002ED77774|nr:unnamed protein product [Priceomyces carsonii]